MSTQQEMKERGRRTAGDDTRERLLSGLPVTERRVQVAGVSTAVLEGGDGPPIVFLQGEFAAVWMRVIPELLTTHRVIAPDLPGLGASEVSDGPPDAEAVLTWLDELIEKTCAIPPVLVGKGPGGALAARFAIEHSDRIDRLVLVDTHGLARFRPRAGHDALLCQRHVAADRARPRTRVPAVLLRRSGSGARRDGRALRMDGGVRPGPLSYAERQGGDAPPYEAARVGDPARRTWTGSPFRRP